MRRVHQATGLILLMLALFFGFEAAGLTYYTRIGPGPGFFPLWLAIILGTLSLGMLVLATREAEPLPADFFPPAGSWLRIGAVAASLFLTAAFLARFGFIATMLAFYLFLLSVLGRRSLVETIALALIGSFGVYYVFTHHLGRPLPAGLISF